ncbi:MAG: Hsp20 family protein [Polyangiaceae bacterium]|nr:Hsp20 family protein [Polyangiaceae bacterium]
MTTLSVKKNDSTRVGVTHVDTPLHSIRPEPFRRLAPFSVGGAGRARFAPDFNVKETKDEFRYSTGLPGMEQRDLSAKATGHQSISDERDEEDQGEADLQFVRDHFHGAFTQASAPPDEAADTRFIRAAIRQGVLTLFLPKLPAVGSLRAEAKTARKPQSK